MPAESLGEVIGDTRIKGFVFAKDYIDIPHIDFIVCYLYPNLEPIFLEPVHIDRLNYFLIISSSKDPRFGTS